MLDLEAPITFKVAGDYSQQEIAIASHEMALDHLRQLANRPYERVDGLFVLTRQPHANEESQPHANFRSIEQCYVPFNDASLFQEPNPAETGRGRQSDALC